MQQVGYTTFRIGGHAALFSDEYQLAAIAVFVVASLASASRADAQGATKPLTIGEVTVAGSFRSRVEAWN